MFKNIKARFLDSPWDFLHPISTVVLLSLIAYLIYNDVSQTVMKVNSIAHYPEEIIINEGADT